MGGRGHSLDTELVALMFALCTKLLENPELLTLFFAEKPAPGDLVPPALPQRTTPAKDARAAAPRAGRKAAGPLPVEAVDADDPVEEHEFPVFVYLLRFIDHTGKIGDYARTALLHCLEVRRRRGGAGPRACPSHLADAAHRWRRRLWTNLLPARQATARRSSRCSAACTATCQRAWT
jgi:hypothetical protein